jgi:exopolysaccharide biosynthesis polyprenyl glycosylphosphotransferase
MTFETLPEASAPDVRLPKGDVRRALDASVRRGWTEHTRRAVRVAFLLVSDTMAGLAGVATVIGTWSLVDAGGLKPVPSFIPLAAMVLCIQPLALRATGAYGGGRARISLGRVAGALVIATFVGWIQAHLFGGMTPDLPNKTAYLYAAGLITLFAFCGRHAIDQVIRLGFKTGHFQRRVLLIGHRDEVADLQRRVDHDRASYVKVVAAMSPRLLIDDLTAIDSAIVASRAHDVVLAAGVPFELRERVIARCFVNAIGVSLLPSGVQSVGSASFELRQSQLGLLLHVSPMRLRLPQLALKRTMDLLLTLAGLAVIWPLFLLVALAIKLDSRGPVFFSQRRVGVGGRPFRMLKFRTMHVGADAMKRRLAHLNASGDARLFKIPNDPRVTRVGRFLRQLSLDELPQVLNVLVGDMSLVGPRPFFSRDLAAYQIHHFERLHVLPGITGLWQVSGRSDIIDFEEVVRLDREYIRNWSVAADLLILLKTVPAALGRGAY